MLKKMRFLTVPAILACLVSCGRMSASSVPFDVYGTDGTLYALNSAARDGVIEAGREGWGYAYFSFPEGTELPAGTSLTVTAELSGGGTYRLALAFLFERDFRREGVLRDRLDERAAAGNSAETPLSAPVSVSLAVPPAAVGEVKGFAVYMETSPGSDAALHIVSACAGETKLGWDFSSSVPWYGFGWNGGMFSSGAVSVGTDSVFASGTPYVLSAVLADDPAAVGTPSQQERVRFSVSAGGGKEDSISIRCAPGQDRLDFYSVLFSRSVPAQIDITAGAGWVRGLVVSPAAPYAEGQADALPVPILSDPGVILDWPRELWRQPGFELFSWQQFPSVLIFDTADYRVQDRFFKRLAFFTEKQGFVGTLAKDSDIAHLHAYNAHDYRAESLAAFFELARQRQFPLNDEELLLKDILLETGVIRSTEAGLVPGEGAVISISQESPEYLRYMFIPHEGLHGVYFTDAAFREEVAVLYESLSTPALEFLHGYFSAIDSLNYDTEDDYLMQNEFMAYIAQQPVSRVADYFLTNLAGRLARRSGYAEQVAYIRRTGAADFVRAAENLDAYLFDRWGFSCGRVSLAAFIPAE